MSKFFQAFFSGIPITFMLDFFLFLGIFQNYIRYHKIDLYYNILFADNQNIYIFVLGTLLFGLMITYINNTKFSLITIGIFLAITLSTLLSPVGKKVGEIILMQKNITLHDNLHTYKGDIYYMGRKTITFYEQSLKKVIILDKNRLINKGKNK